MTLREIDDDLDSYVVLALSWFMDAASAMAMPMIFEQRATNKHTRIK